jgi:uroporphyrinogen decarboxylase
MTSLERIGAVIAGEFADRPPFALVLSLYGARLTESTPARYYREPELYLEGQKAVVDRFSPDIVFGPFALALEAEAWGAGLAWTEKAPPNVGRPAKASARELLAQDAPILGSDPRLDYLVESLRLLAAEFADDRSVAAVLTAPVDLPALLLGIDAWMDILLFDPEQAAALLDLSSEHFIALSRAYFAAGAAFVVTPVMFANPRILSRGPIESLVLPALSKAFAAAGGPIIFHHGANRTGEALALFRSLPGVAGFVLDEQDDLARAREILGQGPVILGGFAGPLMENRSPDRIAGLARAALEERRGDPRFILASTAADIPWDTPAESIDVVGSVARVRASPHV